VSDFIPNIVFGISLALKQRYCCKCSNRAEYTPIRRFSQSILEIGVNSNLIPYNAIKAGVSEKDTPAISLITPILFEQLR
jgi:hypothetical protein